MAISTYDEALRRLLVHEGGYSDHPSDPGGPTKFGITIHDYRKYAKPDASAADVRAMTLGEAKAIYKSRYWNAMHCEDLPAGVDYAVFDYGVNSGVGRAPKVLQRALGVTVDGQIGRETLAAARSRDAKAVIEAVCDERLRFLKSLQTWPVFGRGWGRRVREVRAAALAMSDHATNGRQTTGAAANPSVVVPAASAVPGKGAVPLNRGAQAGTAGAAAAVGTAAAAQSSEPAIIFIILVAAISVAIGAFFFWRWWQARQQDAAA
jgi:lysozyme family protein